MFFGGHGFGSTTWLLGDVGLSLQLCFLGVESLSPHFMGGGCGFESTFCFGGRFFFNFVLLGGDGFTLTS